MPLPLDRRHFLHGSVALGGSLLSGSVVLDHAAHAAIVRIDAPQVERIVVREVTDGAHDIFLRGSEAPGLTVQRTAMTDAAQSTWNTVRTKYRFRKERVESSDMVCMFLAHYLLVGRLIG